MTRSSFAEFIAKTYGSMADDPIPEKPSPNQTARDNAILWSGLVKPFGNGVVDNEFDISKLRDELPNHAYAMKVLCVDEINKLQIVKTVKEVKYIPVVLLGTTPDYYEIVEKDSPEYEYAMIGLLIES
jgi:hypothetical protein